MTPEQRERIRLLTLDGLPASRIATLMGLHSKPIVSCQRGLGLAHVAAGNARRFKVAGLLTASPPKQRATLFAVPVDFSPSPAGDFVRMPCPLIRCLLCWSRPWVTRQARRCFLPTWTTTMPEIFRLIGEPVFAGFAADPDGFFEEDALTEREEIGASAVVDVSRDERGIYRLEEPIFDDVLPGTERMTMDEALDLVRSMLLEGGLVTLRPDITDSELLDNEQRRGGE